MLEGEPGDPPLHHGGELAGRPRRGGEQLGLVLGEDATGGPEPGDDGGRDLDAGQADRRDLYAGQADRRDLYAGRDDRRGRGGWRGNGSDVR
ncbi:hypothetical protein GCM10014719_32730 [Planomonospora parontospora subsp. antibiotica]|nr:hypothetical protein GCM10014719_32730 [Planomonospora parontospora subsp. antibiotica]GII18072.1 hypothetical protein Ppa05_47980 [Planomonospora parontospora subsp. antibiotica]